MEKVSKVKVKKGYVHWIDPRNGIKYRAYLGADGPKLRSLLRLIPLEKRADKAKDYLKNRGLRIFDVVA
jgi:hypothetical protein